MDFDAAIGAHISWKYRLGKFIDGIDAELGSDSPHQAPACQDKFCDLGLWLHGQGAHYKRLPEYRQLLKQHSHFHACAQEVVKRVKRGDKAGAKSLLYKDFAQASRDTVAAIAELKLATATLTRQRRAPSHGWLRHGLTCLFRRLRAESHTEVVN
jgi:hypothetical protein